MHRGAAPSSPLPRQVKLFGWVSLLNDFASEMIYPLLPAFVTGVLGRGAQALGALDGAAEFAAAFVKLGAGRLADRVPRRGPMIVLGYFISVVVRPVIAVTGAAWQVIALRVVDRLGKGLLTPPRDAPSSRRRCCGDAPSACSAAWITRERCWARSSRGGCSRPGGRTCGRSSGGASCLGWWSWCLRSGRCGAGEVGGG